MSKDKLDKIDNCLFELLELVETFNEIRTKSNKELSSVGIENYNKLIFILNTLKFINILYNIIIQLCNLFIFTV